MKLVEILAREMEVWPDPATGARQYGDMVRFFDEGCGMMHVRIPLVASDQGTAVVTREQWQAEREKLAPWFASEPACCHCIEMDVEFPTVSIGVGADCSPEWDGIGLPPVGAVCEVSLDFDEHPSESNWAVIKVIHSDEWVVVGSIIESENGYNKGMSVAYEASIYEFRSWLTPEQIAADVRNKVVGEMVSVWKGTMGRFAEEERGLAEMLYDAGYRKP